jgi:ribosome-binding protein aMBF1 (putative translation factor)
MDDVYGENIVEAIDDGRIVKVSEDHAKREGLLILRKTNEISGGTQVESSGGFENSGNPVISDPEAHVGLEDLRKPLDWRNQQVTQELIDNFHWHLSKARRERNLTRKQVADDLNESEKTIKLLENGIVPSKDFVLINKVQGYFGINLRRDGKDFGESARGSLGEETEQELGRFGLGDEEVILDDNVSFVGDDVEIIDDQ